MTMAAIYARVFSDRQKQEHTIDSQIIALSEFAHSQALMVPEQCVFQDEGYSGATVVRPALERLRDLACEGTLEAILVYSPDRLSCKYAYQVRCAIRLSLHEKDGNSCGILSGCVHPIIGKFEAFICHSYGNRRFIL